MVTFDFYAKDLDEAYKLGHFQGSMSRDEFLERITRYNDELHLRHGQDYVGVFTQNRLVVGIPATNTLPKFPIFSTSKHDESRMLARGWYGMMNSIEKQGFKIDKRGI